jgi:hypothetical protein
MLDSPKVVIEALVNLDKLSVFTILYLAYAQPFSGLEYGVNFYQNILQVRLHLFLFWYRLPEFLLQELFLVSSSFFSSGVAVFW